MSATLRDYIQPLKTPAFRFRKVALLTGAGFSKDCGGFLADEMWAWIFNSAEAQGHPNVAAALRDETDYEIVYSRVHTSVGFDAEDRLAISAAVRCAYLLQDDAIRNFRGNSPRLREFVSIFQGQTGNDRGYFFTLNQDAFVERHLSQLDLHYPGVPKHPGSFNGFSRYQGDMVAILSGGGVDMTAREDCAIGRKLHYVKLHGSFNWHSSVGDRVMVIGTQKDKLIEGEELLRYYSFLFARVLKETTILCVIGYSFRDHHINKALAKAIDDHRLALCVISPLSASQFRQSLKNCAGGHANALLRGLVAYFPWSVEQLLLKEQHPARSELYRVLTS
jgi:hypothetical protein